MLLRKKKEGDDMRRERHQKIIESDEDAVAGNAPCLCSIINTTTCQPEVELDLKHQWEC